MGNAINALDFWGGLRTFREMALFESIPNLKALHPFAISSVTRGSGYSDGFQHPLGQPYPISQYLNSHHKSQAFNFLLLIHHDELGKTLSKSLQQLPWHHHQKWRHFDLFFMELCLSSIHQLLFPCSTTRDGALRALATSRLQGHNLLSQTPPFNSSLSNVYK